MKIGILGTGDVGNALGHGFITLNHQVMMGSRQADHPKAVEWVEKHGKNASQSTFDEAAQFGEIIVLATRGVATPDVIKAVGIENFKGKIVLDATNPLDFSKGNPPALVGNVGDSGGEKHQKQLHDSHVVKVFNTVGSPFMFRPQFADGTPDMFICGNNAKAKNRVSQICKDFGWGVVDVGDITSSHYLEAMCMVWVISAIANDQNWRQAFKMLRK